MRTVRSVLLTGLCLAGLGCSVDSLFRRLQLLSAGVLYRDYHPAALLTAVGLLAARGWRRRPWRALAVVLPFALYVRRRTWYTRRRYKPVTVPLVLAADLYEVFVLARASVRHRTLVL